MRVANYKLALSEYKKSKGFGANEESQRVWNALCPANHPTNNAKPGESLNDFRPKEIDHLRSIFGTLKQTTLHDGMTPNEYRDMAVDTLNGIGLMEYAPSMGSTYRSLNGPRYCETTNGRKECKVRRAGKPYVSFTFTGAVRDAQSQYEDMRFPAILKQSDSWRNNFFDSNWKSDYYYFNEGVRSAASKQERDKFLDYFGKYFVEKGFAADEVPGAGQCTAGSVDSVLDGENGMGMFSRALASKDIKTASDGRDAAGVSWDADASSDPAGVDYSKQLVQTYTVNFNAEQTASRTAYLQNGASDDGKYYPVTDYTKLTGVMDEIIGKIQNDTQNTTGGAFASVPPAPVGSGIPDMAASVFTQPGSWSSQLRFYRLNSEGRPDRSSFFEPSFANRKTIIRLNNGVYFTDKLNGTGGIGNQTFAIANKGANGDEWKELLMKWTDRSGDDAALNRLSQTRNGNADKYSQQYRVRPDAERNLGDILDSPVVAAGDEGNDKRREFMVTAANDGMVHLFRKGGQTYDLKLSYIPATMPREDAANNASDLGKTLKDFAHNRYGNDPAHTYGVNGGFVVRQATVGGAKRVFMFGAMGQGGRGAYALDVSAIRGNPNQWNHTVPLFDATDKDMGYTVGTPQVARTYNNMEGYTGFLASGYRTESAYDNANKTALYIYDMFGSKSLIRKIEIAGGMGGLSSPTLVDTDFDGFVDIAYAGDRGGNMYRFNLSDHDPSKWNYDILYRGNPSQPITAAPAVSRRESNKYVVIFGTGSDLTQADTLSKTPQAVYGVFDDVSWDGARGNFKKAPEARNGDLVLQTASKDDGMIFLSNNEIDEKSKKGWKINLAAGERVTLKPTMILRTAVVTIRNYTKTVVNSAVAGGDLCMPDTQGTSTSTETTVLAINAENGGGLTPKKARLIPPGTNNGGNGGGNNGGGNGGNGGGNNGGGNNGGGNGGNGGGGNSTAGCKVVNGQTLCPNGYTFPGPLVPTYLDEKKIGEPPTSPDGDNGGNGNDDGPPPDKNPNNKCFATKGKRTLLMNNMTNIDVAGPPCGLTRISWREVFF